MDELANMRTFVQVIEDGSFSAAARRTRTSVSSIARQIKHLEDTLGVRLLNKTTRSQALTEAGRVYYERAKFLLDELDKTKRDVLAYQSAIKGSLRVYIRVSAAIGVVIPALPRFLAKHPELHLDLIVADGQVDLVSNGIDIAVWLGKLEDSSLIARQLSPSPRVLCGSPAYFKRHGRPMHPHDLARHNCLANVRDYGEVWRFRKNGETIDVKVAGNVQATTSTALFTAVRAGLGLTILPRWMVHSSIDSGEIEAVLTDYHTLASEYESALYAVYPHGRGQSAKARAFIDFLIEIFREHD